MATYYLDPEGGSDANNGTSFALRRRTIAGMTGLTAGDVVRVMASRAPISLGTCDWTDNSSTVTFPSAKSLEIDPGTAAWTASAFVTCATSSTRRTGAASASFTIAAGFTTGLAAYKATGTLDLSAYTAVSFWMRATTVGGLLTTGQMTVRLCSDAAGATPVDTLNFDLGASQALVANNWIPVVIDKGSALGSAIASISIAFSADPGVCVFLINNIHAVKGLADADHISHACLIGKNTTGEPEWYPIRGLSGTSCSLGSYEATTSVSPRNYRGTTQSVTSYALQPVNTRYTLAERTLPTSGTTESHIEWSFGWDRTAMSTLTTDAWSFWSGYGYQASVVVSGTGRVWNKITGLGVVCTTADPIAIGPGATLLDITLVQVTASASWTLGGSGSLGGMKYNLGNLVFCGGALSSFNGGGHGYSDVTVRRVTGCSLASAAVGFGSLTAPARMRHSFSCSRIDNCGIGIVGVLNSSGVLRGCSFDNQAVRDIDGSTGPLYLDNCTFTSSVRQTNNTTSPGGYICLSHIAGDKSASALYGYGWNAITQSSVRHTASGVAWQVNPLNATACNSLSPATISVARIACAASTAITLHLWVRRDSTSVTGGIKVRKDSLPGITADAVATISAAANTWEELTITFTPTMDGVVELEAFAYGGTTHNFYLDDFSVS